MDATAAADALAAWAQEVCDELAGHGYSYPPMGKTKSLPDVVAGVLQEHERVSDERFPNLNIQQRGVHIFDCQLSIMVEAGGTDDEAEAATNVLRSMVARLFAAKRTDPSLGHRVNDTAAEVSADYDPAFVEYADGTRGREVRIDLTVGELLEATT